MNLIVPFTALACALASAAGAQFVADGKVLYATQVNGDELLDVDESTGVVRVVGPIGSPVVSGLAYDAASGRLYGVDASNGNLVFLDPATGATTVVGNTGISTPHGAEIDPADGTLYVSNAVRLYRVDKATGSATAYPSLLDWPVGALAIDPTTGILYGADDQISCGLGCGGQLYTINKLTGVATPLGGIPGFNGLACDADGNLYGAKGSNPGHSYFWLIDKTTLVVTSLGSLPFKNVQGLAICTGCAEVEVLGCGVNPTGSMTIKMGMPAVGDTLQLAIDNPLATQSPGSAVFLAVASAPAAAYPCGSLVPGFGMAGGGALGELLVDVAAPNPFAVIPGPPWAGAGSPSTVSVTVPPAPALIGMRAYAQGLILDASPGALVTFGLADGVELLIGG